MYRRIVLVASSFGVLALMALANPAGAAPPNVVTGAVGPNQGVVGDGSVAIIGLVTLSDGSTVTATLNFMNGNLLSGSFFVLDGTTTVPLDKGAVHKGSVTATGSEANGARATISISSAAITPTSVAANGQPSFTGTVQLRL